MPNSSKETPERSTTKALNNSNRSSKSLTNSITPVRINNVNKLNSVNSQLVQFSIPSNHKASSTSDHRLINSTPKVKGSLFNSNITTKNSQPNWTNYSKQTEVLLRNSLLKSSLDHYIYSTSDNTFTYKY